jgi:hypothetical protein
MNKETGHEDRTTLALALTFAATACATNDRTDSAIEVRHTGDIVEGTLTENGVSVEFKIEHGSRIVIGTRDHFKLIDSTRKGDIGATTILETFEVVDTARFSSDVLADLTAMPEIEVIRDLPSALAAKGIDIDALVNASPALGQILCPTRTAFDSVSQTDNYELVRN